MNFVLFYSFLILTTGAQLKETIAPTEVDRAVIVFAYRMGIRLKQAYNQPSI